MKKALLSAIESAEKSNKTYGTCAPDYFNSRDGYEFLWLGKDYPREGYDLPYGDVFLVEFMKLDKEDGSVKSFIELNPHYFPIKGRWVARVES